MMRFLWLALLCIQTSLSHKVVVKVVESHSLTQAGQSGRSSSYKLKPSRPPRSLCGNSALSQIIRSCYEHEEAQYKYVVCPFQNITQHESATRWNAYHGILGIWSHWSYDDLYSTLTTGHYTDGDDCTKGDSTIPRSVILNHVCGKSTQVNGVSEPETCLYNMTLTSPLFCHTVFTDVYNALPEEEADREEDDQTHENKKSFQESRESSLEIEESSRENSKSFHDEVVDLSGAEEETPMQEYARITAEYQHNILTEAGLREARKRVLERIGCLNHRKKFDTLDRCSVEYHELKNKCDELGKKCVSKKCEGIEEGGEERTVYDELERKYNELKDMLSDNGLLPPDFQ